MKYTNHTYTVVEALPCIALNTYTHICNKNPPSLSEQMLESAWEFKIVYRITVKKLLYK